MGENEYGKSGHLHIFFDFFGALNDAFEVHFALEGFILHHITNTDSL